MIFRICSVRDTLKALFTAKSYLNRFNMCKTALNVRFLCNVQLDMSKSMGLVDIPNPGKGSVETAYFKNLMENNPKYPDFNFSEKFLKANENSTNKLVIFLRNAVNNKDPQKNESDDFELSSHLTAFEDDAYTLHDFIEIFYLLPIYCELYSKPIKYELKNLLGLMENKIREMRGESKDIGLCLTLLNLMKNIKESNQLAFYFIPYLYYKFKKFTPVQLVEFCYILHYNKFFYEKESIYMFEHYISNAFPKLNFDEIAVISYAFFRSEFHPGSLISETVSGRVLEDIENLNDIQVSTVFKFLKYCGRRRIGENLIKIYKKCIPIIDRLKCTSAIHVIGAGVTVNVEDKELFQVVWNKAHREFDVLRLKDIERLLLTSLYTNFHVTEDSDFVRLIHQKFTKENDEIRKYPKSFYSLLNYLSMHNIYFKDLVMYALSNEFYELVKNKYGKLTFHEILFIEGSVELDRPEYNVTFMPLRKRKSIVMKESVSQVDSSSFRCNKKIMNALQEMYDKESTVCIRPIIHYTTTHPILCLNKNNEPQKIGDKLNYQNFNTVKAPKDGNFWIAFVLLRWQSCLYDRLTPNLVSEAKLRHFRIAGFIPITAYTFLLNSKTDEEMKEYLSKAIKDTIQSLNN